METINVELLTNAIKALRVDEEDQGIYRNEINYSDVMDIIEEFRGNQ